MIVRPRDHHGFPVDVWKPHWLEPGERRFDWANDKLTPKQERTLTGIESMPWAHPLRRRLELMIDAGLWPPAPDDQAAPGRQP